MDILPKLLHRCSAVPIKAPRAYFTDPEKNNPKVYMKPKKKKSRVVKAILGIKSKPGSITIPDFKLYYKATVIKMVWYGHKKSYAHQWKRIEDGKIFPETFSFLIFDKGITDMLEER